VIKWTITIWLWPAQSKRRLRFYCYFGIIPSKPEIGYGYIERKGDDVPSLEKTECMTAADYR
jgi:mannose-1-phosphate guanylyltransferase